MGTMSGFLCFKYKRELPPMSQQTQYEATTDEESVDRDSEVSVFISYSRVDIKAADLLSEQLRKRHFEPLIDRRDIPFGEEWKKELVDLIYQSEAVVVLLSRDSAQSEWVNWELDEAKRTGKKIIPVILSEMDDIGFPAVLRSIQHLPSTGVFNLEEHLEDLCQSLMMDRDWMKQSTQLLNLARQWHIHDRSKDRLLFGDALQFFEDSVRSRPSTTGRVAEEVLEFLTASGQAKSRRLRQWVLGSLVVAATAAAVAIFALFQRQTAIEQRDLALLQESRFLAGLAQNEAEEGRENTAIALALEALPDHASGNYRPTSRVAETTLNRILAKQRLLYEHFSPGSGTSTAARVAGERIVALTLDELVIWDAQSGAELHVLERYKTFDFQDSFVTSFSVSSDGGVAVVGYNNGTIEIWDTGVGTLLGRYRQHVRAVQSIDLNADGSVAVTGSSDQTANIWSTRTGEVVETIDDFQSGVSTVAVSDDGSVMAFLSEDYALRIWDGKELYEQSSEQFDFVAFEGPLLFQPNSKVLIVGGFDNTYIFEGPRWVEKGTLPATGLRTGVSFSSDGSLLLLSEIDKNLISLWQTDDWSKQAEFVGHTDFVTSVAFSKDDSQIITGSDDKTFRIWDTNGGDLRHSFDVKSEEPIRFEQVAFHSNENMFHAIWYLLGDSTRNIQVWSGGAALESVEFAAHNSRVTDLSFSPDGASLLSVSDGGTFHLLHFTKDTEVRSKVEHKGPICCVGFHPDGSNFVTGSEDTMAVLWDSANGQLRSTLEGHNFTHPEINPQVLGLAFSPTGSHIVVAFNGGDAKVFEAEGGNQIATFNGNSGLITSIDFSHDGQRVLTGDSEGNAHIWSTQSGIVEAKFSKSGTSFTDASFFHDEEHVVMLEFTSQSPALSKWNISTSKEVARLEAHCEEQDDFFDDLTCQFFFASHHGELPLSIVGGTDRVARIIDTDEMLVLATHRGHSDIIGEGQISLDGKLAATLAFDGEVRVWDVASGSLVTSLKSHVDKITEFSFSPDNSRIATASDGGQVQIWTIPQFGQELVVSAKRAVRECLSPEERSSFFLSSVPPRWCLTGLGFENEGDPSNWRPLPPYQRVESENGQRSVDLGE